MKTKSALPAEIDELRQRLNQWRQTPGRRRRLPEAIWEAAADLARTHRISLVARTLGLSYQTLSQRVLGVGPGGTRAPKPAFVEVAWAPSTSGAACTIELKNRRGATMSIRLGA